MILLIDNYDSFTYNLVQVIGTINPDIKVIRNDAMSVEEIEKLKPSHIILSPGPGYPKDAGVCEKVVRKLQGKIPILGVCLGHQAICEVYGAKITHARKLMHGKKSRVKIETESPIFAGMEEEIEKISGIGTVTEAAKKAVEAFGEKTLEELTEENKRLQEENERLKNRSIKERMYDKINVSVRTIDIFIGCMCVLFVAVVVMGMLK